MTENLITMAGVTQDTRDDDDDDPGVGGATGRGGAGAYSSGSRSGSSSSDTNRRTTSWRQGTKAQDGLSTGLIPQQSQYWHYG